MLGPFSRADLKPLPSLHINRFGVMPKGHNNGKWRLITDFSYPAGESVNDGIATEPCSLTYTKVHVEKVAGVAAQLGRGTHLAKIDIVLVYRLIPVHPGNRPLQAVEWRGNVYIDPMLPFGLRSAPKLFNAVADALEWYLRQRSSRQVSHYLDYFIVVAPRACPECARALDTLNESYVCLGIPIAEHKWDGPPHSRELRSTRTHSNSGCQLTSSTACSHASQYGVKRKHACEGHWNH